MGTKSEVTIRCALQSFNDIRVSCPHEWTVDRLKEHIRDVCSDRPEPSGQRLIYFGQCLEDQQLVGKLLRRDEDGSECAHVFHLVYAPAARKLHAEAAAALRRRSTEPQLRQRRTAPVPVENNAASLAQQPPQVSHPAFYYGTGGAGQTTTAQSWFGPPAAAFLVQPPNQLDGAAAALAVQQQQLYHAYATFYANYMQQWYQQSASTGGGGIVDTLNGQQNGTPPAAAFLPAQAERRPAGEQQRQHEQPPMNAQGGVADADDMAERDWLDWIYTSFRFGLFLMILYFYSSFERFVFVTLCVAVVYLAGRGGWFGRRGAPNRPEEARNREPAVAAGNDDNHAVAAAAEEAQQAENGAGMARSEGQAAPAEVEEEHQTPWTVFWTTCYTFITSFFVSLLPQQPPPLNIN